MARIKDEDQFMQHYKEYMAPECRAQLPAFNRVGRGLRGDGFIVEKDNNSQRVILIGSSIDAKTGVKHEEWTADIMNDLPRIDYRMYRGQVNNQDGWWMHFKASVPSTGQVLWSFDTPFIFGDYTVDPPEPSQDDIMSGSY